MDNEKIPKKTSYLISIIHSMTGFAALGLLMALVISTQFAFEYGATQQQDSCTQSIGNLTVANAQLFLNGISCDQLIILPTGVNLSILKIFIDSGVIVSTIMVLLYIMLGRPIVELLILRK